MKKLILLIVLIPFMGFAKFYKGTVTMNDGSLKKGFIELPEYPDDKKLKFRNEERGKTEKLEIESVKGFEIINDKNEVVNYLTIFLAEPKIFTNDQFTFDKKKSWVKVIKEGKISIYSAYAIYNQANGTGGISSSYVKKTNEDYAYFFSDGSGGFNINMNGFSFLKKMIGIIFKNDCPKLADLIVKDDIKKNGYTHIVKLYEENCGK
jgi:hypothetical protein